MESSQGDLLGQILSTLQSVRDDHQKLSTIVQRIQSRLDAGIELSGKQGVDSLTPPPATLPPVSSSTLSLNSKRDISTNEKMASPQRGVGSGTSSRIILTTYPGQSGINPILMNWGHPDPAKRGPVVVSRSQSTIRRRNGMRLR